MAKKAPTARPARLLYVSPLFQGRRAYAEASGKPWFILSALHGLVNPDQEPHHTIKRWVTSVNPGGRPGEGK